MSTLKHFCSYWAETFRGAKDDREMISSVLIAISGGLGALGYTFNFSPIVSAISISAAAVLLLRAIFWRPFQRHKALEQQHSDELRKLHERQKPNFDVQCNANIDGCCLMNGSKLAKFLRVSVKTHGVDSIQDCKGHLTKIIKVSNGRRDSFDNDTFTLPFAPSHEPDSVSKTVSPGVQYFVDVLAIGAINPGIVVATKDGGRIATDKHGNHIFSSIGEYILTVSIAGENTKTVESEIKLIWSGHYGSVEWEKVK